ncbi:DUF2690 domain-containing protein [Streptomyces sp. HUAS TT3]|uniref:DUF2690 domain-containing protein n=1 Tax=Streptomyces sp. HUAS TT3 TaxID=3447510 RepID=UPI003F65BD75
MTFPTRRSTTLATTLGLAASSLLLASSPASAATSCYGSSCNGLDPANTVCQNDAKTVYWDGWRAIELRYSPSCRAAWTRQQGVGGPDGEPMTLIVENTAGQRYTTAWNGHTAWTRMVNDKDIKAHAGGVWDNGKQFSYTEWY